MACNKTQLNIISGATENTMKVSFNFSKTCKHWQTLCANIRKIGKNDRKPFGCKFE